MSRKAKTNKNYKMYNETLYQVQKVVQIKWIKNRQFCYIKWKGYDEKYNTWQPKDHITFCYNYCHLEEKDDDSEYQDNIAPITTPANHHYQTRAKNKSPSEQPKNVETESKEDHTELEERQVVQNIPILPIEKPVSESNGEELEIRRKDDPQQIWTSCRNALVAKILSLPADKSKQNKKRIGKVEMLDGKIAYIYEDILKLRYPDKVIEYYENQMRNRCSPRD